MTIITSAVPTSTHGKSSRRPTGTETCSCSTGAESGMRVNDDVGQPSSDWYGSRTLGIGATSEKHECYELERV